MCNIVTTWMAKHYFSLLGPPKKYKKIWGELLFYGEPGGRLPINILRILTFSIFFGAPNYRLKSRPNVGQSPMESSGPTLLNTSFSTYLYHKTHPGDTITWIGSLSTSTIVDPLCLILALNFFSRRWADRWLGGTFRKTSQSRVVLLSQSVPRGIP